MKNTKLVLGFIQIILLVVATGLIAQNNALEFDGTEDYVNCGVINLSFQSFAIEGWFKIDELPPTSGNYLYDDIFGIESGVDATLLRINGANQKLEFVMGWNSGTQVITSNMSILTGQWYHVAILFHQSARNMYIVINGKIDVIYNIPAAGTNYSNQTFRIGGDGNYRSFDGQIDEVKVWGNLDRGENDIRNELYEEIVGNETGLMAYYKMNETSGTIANDAQTSSTYDGTLTNMSGTEWTPSSAFFGPKNCFYFNGSNAYASIGSSPYYDNFYNGTAITIEYWFKGTVLQSAVRFQDMSNNYVIAGYGAGDPEFIISTEGGVGNGLTIGTSSMLEDGIWHHVACTWQKNTINGFKTYVDGILTNQKNSANVNLPAINYNGVLGAHHGPTELLNGQLDEVRIWTDVRTESEIRENMTKTLTGNESNLVMYYNFDGYTLPNVVGINYDGVLSNVVSQTSTAFNTWLNTSSSSWSTAANWSHGSVPSSTDNVGIINYPGGTAPILSGSPTVHNFVVDDTFTLSSSLTINGNLILESDLDLNGQAILLGSSAMLVEDSGFIFGDTGTIQTTRSLDNIDEDVAGLGAEITTTSNMGSTTIIRGHTPQGSQGIERFYRISPTNTGLNATLVFNYLDSELNGVTESDLKLFKAPDGLFWMVQSSSILNSLENTLTLSGIDSFSSWTAGSLEGLPVILSSLTVRYASNNPILSWTTQSEVNNAYWNVYRSISQNLGQAIQLNTNEFIEGAGSTSEPTYYTYTDENGVEENNTYYYWIESVDYSGKTEMYGSMTLFIPFGGSTDGTPETPDIYGLHQNYPNPFNPSTLISFTLQEGSNVKLTIYNVKGKKIKTIMNDYVEADQNIRKVWDGTDCNGKQASAGIYYYELTTRTKKYHKKMVLVK